MREPKPHAGRPVVQHFLEYALVLGNGADFAGFVAVPLQSRTPPLPNPSIACLTWAKAEGLTESSRKPHDKQRGNAARIAGHFTAQTDADAGALAVLRPFGQ